jgi:hypothetical protein
MVEPESSPDKGNNQRVMLGRGPLALRFGLTLLALLMGVVVLAWAGQWVLSIIMLVILVLVAMVLYVWARKG